MDGIELKLRSFYLYNNNLNTILGRACWTVNATISLSKRSMSLRTFSLVKGKMLYSGVLEQQVLLVKYIIDQLDIFRIYENR